MLLVAIMMRKCIYYSEPIVFLKTEWSWSNWEDSTVCQLHTQLDTATFKIVYLGFPQEMHKCLLHKHTIFLSSFHTCVFCYHCTHTKTHKCWHCHHVNPDEPFAGQHYHEVSRSACGFRFQCHMETYYWFSLCQTKVGAMKDVTSERKSHSLVNYRWEN